MTTYEVNTSTLVSKTALYRSRGMHFTQTFTNMFTCNVSASLLMSLGIKRPHNMVAMQTQPQSANNGWC